MHNQWWNVFNFHGHNKKAKLCQRTPIFCCQWLANIQSSVQVNLFIYLGFTSLSTLYRSYHDG